MASYTTSESSVSSRSGSKSLPGKKGEKGGKVEKGGKGKKLQSGYIKYFLNKLKDCKGVRVTEVAKMAGKEWCKLTPEQKQGWEKK